MMLGPINSAPDPWSIGAIAGAITSAVLMVVTAFLAFFLRWSKQRDEAAIKRLSLTDCSTEIIESSRILLELKALADKVDHISSPPPPPPSADNIEQRAIAQYDKQLSSIIAMIGEGNTTQERLGADVKRLNQDLQVISHIIADIHPPTGRASK